MNEKFILLTNFDRQPIIIGLSNIASIMAIEQRNDRSQTRITLNFPRSEDLRPKTIDVFESFDEIRTMLGL